MHIRKPRAPGKTTLVSHPESRELTLERWRLAGGHTETVRTEGSEAVLVLLEGEVALEASGQTLRASRQGPFAERASAFYLPPHIKATIRAERGSELAAALTPCDEAGEVAMVGPDGVQVNARGRDGYIREVHDIFVNDHHAKRLLVGETFNPPGGWSSYPPHKHDGEDGEPYLEEVYYYRLEPPQGFGSQAIYTKNGGLEACYTVRDGDAVLISRGYHPVAAAPGYRLYYLWALAGEQRQLVVFEDPDHRWLHEAGS